MSTHHIHGEKTKFGHDTEFAHQLFEKEDSKHEFQRLKEEVEKHGEYHLSVEGKKFVVTQEKGEDGKGMLSFNRSHHH